MYLVSAYVGGYRCIIYTVIHVYGFWYVMVKVIVLDLDGTLVEIDLDWDGVREKVREILGVNRNVCLKPLATMVMKFKGPGWRFREALRVIEEAELKSISSARYPGGLGDLLKGLMSCGYVLVLVTLRSMRTTMPLLKRMGVANLFDLVVTRDIVADRFSQLKLVLEGLYVGVDEVLFIGDTGIDVEAGLRLGVRTIRVSGPEKTVEKLRELLERCWERR